MTTNPTAPIPCQRWRDRRDSFRSSAEPFDPSRFGVELIETDSVAREFVKRHHYSGSYPAARVRVGLYRSAGVFGDELVGVAVFSVPMSQRVIPKYTGRPSSEGVELGRFVLLDDVRANAESWFLSRAFGVLAEAKPEVAAVLSYSDPVRRTAADGSTVLPGHVGTIYQATNARYVGRSKYRNDWIAANGRIVSPRALSKIRKGETGARYATAKLLELGAPARRFGEDPAEWVRRALSDGPFRKVRHPGNHAYLFAVGGSKRQRRQTAKAFPPSLPYPKADAGGVVLDLAA